MYLRKLPSGLWQVTVRGPDGKRHTKTDRLKSVVKQWGSEQEAALARGDFRDPKVGNIKGRGVVRQGVGRPLYRPGDQGQA